MNRFFPVGVLIFTSFVVPGCNRGKDATTAANGRRSYAFVTNGVADFWEHARAGATAAGKEYNVDVSVIMPSSITDQTRKIEDLLTRGTDGIAISPIDPENQGDTINKAAAQTNLITHDSDAPQTNRLMYIGMDNYHAGFMCGKTLRDAMPDGGKIVIFIGRLDQDNSKRRCQGVVDGFLGIAPNPKHNSPLSQELVSTEKKYTIVGTMTDQFDFSKAKANVEDAVTRYPDVNGMVGLFEYNPPLIIEALERVGKIGKVRIMGFDENSRTLDGIKNGTVVATVVQNPYQYGYQSIKVLNALHKGNKSVIPESKFIDIPARVIDKSNVDAFQKEISERLGKK
jgi:ribose transport system substrate-binding protein